jgi:hypothetical protein
VLLYAGLRIPIDLLREYPVNALGLAHRSGFQRHHGDRTGAFLLAINWWRWHGLGPSANHRHVSPPNQKPRPAGVAPRSSLSCCSRS